MSADLEFILGLIDRDDPAQVTQDDFDGAHGKTLRLWQKLGFLSAQPGMQPVPSCPHCGVGTPYLLGERCLCNLCRSNVDRRHLLAWRFDLEAFLAWMAGR